MYSAVLFDCFGTLTRAVVEADRTERLALVAAALGCDPRAYRAVQHRSFFRRAAGRCGPVPDMLRCLARHAGVDPTETQVRAAVPLSLSATRLALRLRPDAVATLTELRRRRLRTAVVSDCTQELPLLFPQLTVAGLVDAAVFSCDVGACKPAPAMYAAACERVGVPPAGCLYVGDGGSRELTGAREFGMTAVLLAEADLVDHLRHDAEPAWQGGTVGSLTGVLSLV